MHPMRRRTFLALLSAAALAACSDQEERSPLSSDEKGGVTDASTAAHKVKWLEFNATLTPAQWLASRNEDRVRGVSDPEVLRIEALLDTAHRIYSESPRMIANRAVQIEGMIAAMPGAESATAGESATLVLEDLAAIAGEHQTEGFGAIGQHYVNLRASGQPKDAAIAELKQRYGKRN